jgi:hypothetical protein
LTTTGEQVVALLEKNLRPAVRTPRPDPQRLAQLIADLNNDNFAVREKATQELAKLGDTVRPALTRVLAGQPSPETRRRVEQLLNLAEPSLTAEEVRQVRCVEVLEHIGNAEARRLLKTLAGGEPGAVLTREAGASLDRLAKRTARRP